MFLNTAKAAYYFGKAIKNFNKENYKVALELFHKVERLEAKSNVETYTNLYFYIGMCFLYLGEKSAAFSNMEKCYGIFQHHIKSLNDETERYYFYTLSIQYSKLLYERGEKEKANEIMLYLKKLMDDYNHN